MIESKNLRVIKAYSTFIEGEPYSQSQNTSLRYMDLQEKCKVGNSLETLHLDPGVLTMGSVPFKSLLTALVHFICFTALTQLE